MRFHVLNDLYYKDFHAGFKASYDVYEIIRSDIPTSNTYNFYKVNLKDSKYRIRSPFQAICKLLQLPNLQKIYCRTRR